MFDFVLFVIELWGLKPNGQFVGEVSATDSTFSRWVPRSVSSAPDVRAAILEDLKVVCQQYELEAELFSTSAKSSMEKGQRLLYLFQKDLMPGVSGKILESKQNRDSFKPKEVSAGLKLSAWIFVILLNLGMLFYIMLFALQETKSRQGAWLRSFLTWLVLEIVFVSTAVVYFTHILVPSIIMRDVSKIKMKLLDTIRNYNNSLKSSRGNDGSNLEETFNAASYLFVSYRLATLFPELKESQIIKRFSTVWPKNSYKHSIDTSKMYSKKFAAVSNAATMILIFLIGSMLHIPPTFQDMVIHIAVTTSVGYSILLHLQLYQIYPVLVICPVLFIGVVAHFLIQSGKARSKMELSQTVIPVEDCHEEKVDVDVSSDDDSNNDDNIHGELHEPSSKQPVDIKPTGFRTRRESLKVGKALVSEIHRLNGQSKAVSPKQINIGNLSGGSNHLIGGGRGSSSSSSSSGSNNSDENELYALGPDYFAARKHWLGGVSENINFSSDSSSCGTSDSEKNAMTAMQEKELEDWIHKQYGHHGN